MGSTESGIIPHTHLMDLVKHKQKENTPEKKLPVEIGQVNSVHVNHMNETKPRQGLKHNPSSDRIGQDGVPLAHV